MATVTGKYRTRKLDDNGDPVISGTVWLYDIEAIAQTIKQRLKLFAGEYWRDVTDGTPWLGKILGKNTAQNTIQAKSTILKNRILSTEGVYSILKWESDFDYSERSFYVTATVLTEFGSIDLTEDLSDTSIKQDEDIELLTEAVALYNLNSTRYTEILQ
jgi:hypothetical protein